MSEDIDAKARIAAAGACALIADGQEDAAQSLLKFYLADSMPTVGPLLAMQRLVAATLGVAVTAVGDSDPFRQLAMRLASSGETV